MKPSDPERISSANLTRLFPGRRRPGRGDVLARRREPIPGSRRPFSSPCDFPINGAVGPGQAAAVTGVDLDEAAVATAKANAGAVFTNWSVTDPNGRCPLKVAGPGSVRVGSRDARVQYTGTSWAEMDSTEGFYWHGFAHRASAAGDSVTVRYTCQFPHDLYLGSSLYRIHGTNEPWTIGQNVSSGCIRMMNEDVTDLYGRVGVGTRVVVM